MDRHDKVLGWALVVVNLVFFPLVLGFELAHYAIYREWMSFSPSELWNEVFESAR